MSKFVREERLGHKTYRRKLLDKVSRPRSSSLSFGNQCIKEKGPHKLLCDPFSFICAGGETRTLTPYDTRF